MTFTSKDVLELLERWRNMALDLLKLVLLATSTTTLGPDQNGYYYLMGADTFSTTFPIAAGSFQNNAGDTITQFPTVSTNGYYTVAINGVQQKSDVISYGTSTLTLTFATAVTLNANEVIDLQVVDYNPTTVTTAQG